MIEGPPVVVRRSRVQGRGVFATRPIASGERIIEYTGRLITNEEADSGSDDEAMRRHHTFLFGVDDEYTIDGGDGGNEARFINHSCDPSCESITVRRRVYIHALRDIEAGEELTYDYWYTTDDGYSLDVLRRLYPCRCKAASCRGTLARPPTPTKKSTRSPKRQAQGR
ncbi:MAG TPA: SET domain-containing protein-lysine N-methyltransferase [Polyangiaceae bacterium]